MASSPTLLPEIVIIKLNKWNVVAQHNYDELFHNPPNSPANFLTDEIDKPTLNNADQESSHEESPNHSLLIRVITSYWCKPWR